MDQLNDSENNAKVSDSAYSNSCSNSQSRRSHSSKSTHSGSNSSGSSGYGGKPSAYSDNSGQPAEKRSKEKDVKKKKQVQIEKAAATTIAVLVEAEESPPEPAPAVEAVNKDNDNVARTPSPAQVQAELVSEKMDIAIPNRSISKDEDGFSCVISMHDGVVMYTTSSITTTLGFPKDMWIGRSFIDFVHPKDRNTFASHISSGLAVPKNVNGTKEEVPSSQNPVCTMVCRIRRYRSLSSGFGVKERGVTFMPFLLKLSLKNIEEGTLTYLVIQAMSLVSAFKAPNEIVANAVPFVIRHAANGNMEYIDPESVPYLGYLPQDLADTDVLQLYHPDDLPYLCQVYETIVKVGGIARSKSYRMMAQNGDFIRVETNWSSFINPWSRKLEFVIGKHHIIEGPSNPDVFQPPEVMKYKVNEEEKNKILALRESIIRTMNEVLTKPAEMAKQQMSKRCQDLASFMESLIEEEPKTEDEFRLEIQDPDNSYERDSVMLGGISPHHDHNDSKSSTETPLSYNQLNYNETLQRYFKSHQANSYDEYNTVAGVNILGMKNLKSDIGKCVTSTVHCSGDSGEMSSCDSGGILCSSGSASVPAPDHFHTRLTQSLLNRHNTVMEKELMKVHRETRSSSKGERNMVKETRLKKKEHLARCNAAFQPTSVQTTTVTEIQQPHGVKRASKQQESEGGMHKHHCPAPPRQCRRRHAPTAAPGPVPTTSTITTAVATHWPGSSVNGMNTFILGVGIPPQMSLMSPMTPMPGMFPMYYTPSATPAMSSSADASTPMSATTTAHLQQQQQQQHQNLLNQMQSMMYGQAMYSSPFMYTPMNTQLSYPIQQNTLAVPMQSMHTAPMNTTLGLARSNYEEACKASLPIKPKGLGSCHWREMKLKNQNLNKIDPSYTDSSASSNTLNRSTEPVQETTPSRGGNTKNSEETMDRTDGDSSFSSFYSSFFKTESGSGEDSGDVKKVADQDRIKKIARRKIDPPWMEQVCVTSELVYKYQILTKSKDEVLEADKLKMKSYQQPSLVNEQLSQLYLDLQLEGVAATLTLEEGITSSSSSGEETSGNVTKVRRKREYSKLVMIYEEDAPLPPASEEMCAPVSPATAATETQ